MEKRIPRAWQVPLLAISRVLLKNDRVQAGVVKPLVLLCV